MAALPVLLIILVIIVVGVGSARAREQANRAWASVADASFDNPMSVKGADAEAVRAFLNPERREQIRQFVMSHRGAVIADGAVTWSKRGRMTRAPELLAAVQEMLVIGRALAEPVPEPDFEAVPESDARTEERHEDSAQMQSLDGPDVAAQEPGDRPVRAVIQLPADAADLQERIGEPLTFAGTLIRVDGLRHEVFLSDGGFGN